MTLTWDDVENKNTHVATLSKAYSGTDQAICLNHNHCVKIKVQLSEGNGNQQHDQEISKQS